MTTLPKFLVLSLALHALCAEAATPSDAEARTAEAHRALLRQDYDGAASAFAAAESLLRAGAESGVDAALYWQAYIALQQRRPQTAERLLKRLLREFPTSTWRSEARALLARNGGGLAALRMLETVGDQGSGTAEKEAAAAEIDRLLSTDPATASVRLRALIVAPNANERVAARALYALALLDQGQAERLALQLIEGGAVTATVRADAGTLLASSADPWVQQQLEQRYPGLDAPQRMQVANAWASAGRSNGIKLALAGERDPAVRWQLINALGVLHEEAALVAIVRDASAPSEQLAAINGLAFAERAQALIDLLDDPALASLRPMLLRGLGTAGGQVAITQLVNAFASGDAPTRATAAEALGTAEAGAELIALLRSSTDTDDRLHLTAAIRRLHDPALDAQLEILLDVLPAASSTTRN